MASQSLMEDLQSKFSSQPPGKKSIAGPRPARPQHGEQETRGQGGEHDAGPEPEGQLRRRVYEAAGGGAEDCIPMIEYSSYATAVSACKYLHFNT